VSECESWLAEEVSYEEAAAFCDDVAIKSIVGQELVTNEQVDKETLYKAAQVTREDILRHYRLKDYLQHQTTVKGDWGNHWADLAAVAGVLQSNMTKLHNALTKISHGEAKLLGNVVNGGFVSSDTHPGPIMEISNRDNPYQLEKTDSYFALCLLSHIKTEFPEQFRKIKTWVELGPSDIDEGTIEKFTLVSHRRTFEGKCEICKSW